MQLIKKFIIVLVLIVICTVSARCNISHAARLFDDASSEYLANANAILTGPPLAFVGWFKADASAAEMAILSIVVDGAGSDHFILLSLRVSGGNPQVVRFAHRGVGGAGTSVADTTANWTLNTWQHATGILATNTDRRVFLNAANKDTDSQEIISSGLNTIEIGALQTTSRVIFMSGNLAEVAIYDLSAWPGATDVLKADAFEKIVPSLAAGVSPLNFPLGLVAYYPLIRDINDRVGGFNMTDNGGTVSEHVDSLYPFPKYSFDFTAAAPPAGIEIFRRRIEGY